MTPSLTTRTGRPGTGRRARRIAAVTAVAGLAYTASWIAGLSVAPAGTDVTSDGAAVVRAVSAHQGATVWQYALTEIVPAIALALAVSGVAALAAAQGAPERWTRTLRATALAVAGLSLVQGALGLWLALHAVPANDASTTGLLFATINRADGVKMLIIAVLAVAGLQVGRAGALPRWLSPVAVLLAVTVALSGVGYLLLVPALALAAYASLPLLLVWVTGAALAAARRSRTLA